ncbi:hypothetical protein AS850_03875 [Frondihabitans sp. 762G35]|nr:hypothetical protein AS850_03875 [Frondihabitans sp. 762G35]
MSSLALGILLAGVALRAAPVDAATPAPGLAPTPTATAAPVAPTITVADSDASTMSARGTATPGAKLRILDPQRPASSLCTTTADASGSWGCTIAVPSGADQVVTLRDLTDTALADVDSDPFSVLAAPTFVTSPGLAVGAVVKGAGFPGASVTVMATGASTAQVIARVSSAGAWQVTLPSASFPSGRYALRAEQRSTAVPAVPVSSMSSPLALTIDREAPSAPVLAHPAAGSTVSSQPLVFDGSGEPGAIVTTYVDSNPVCQATVARGGTWRCTSAGLLLPAGTRTVQAAQRDAAGNYGAPTKGSRITFTAAQPTATPGAASPSPVPAPSSPAEPQQTPAPQTTSSPGATPAPPSSGDGGAGPGPSAGNGPQDPGGTAPTTQGTREAGSWTGTTGFGSTLPTLREGLAGGSWLWALALGLVFILLIVAPLRLAATALGGRLALRARRFTGRNRAHVDRDDTPLVSPATGVALALAGGIALVALAVGVDDQLRYVRLGAAIAVGVVVLNGLGVVLPTYLAGRRFGLGLRLRFSARMLVAAALACLVTRLLGLDPPVVLGVLIAATLVYPDGRTLDESGAVRRGGIVAAAQLGSVTVVSFAAWVAHGLLPADTTSFVVEMTRETLATVCLAGLGSLIVLLVPVGGLPGRALYSWSRATLVGLAVVGVAAAGVVFAGDPAETFPVVPLVFASIAFAVVAVSAWVWIRYVEPATEE